MSMDHERWQKIEQLFEAALDHAPERREAFLDAAFGDDPDLRREVALLLQHDVATGKLFNLKPEGGLFDSALSVGMSLGPYRVVGPLGFGGMGKVFRAVDTRLDRHVAVKISSEKFDKRFEREARSISTLNHPNA